MPLFGRRRTVAPRLSPALDDTELALAHRQLTAPQAQGQLELSAVLVEQALHGAGDDWDRRTLRLAVLAEAAAPRLAQVWRRQRPHDIDPLVFQAWTEVAEARRNGRVDDPRALVRSCRTAADARPQDPTPLIALLRLLRLMGRPPKEVYQVCGEIGARDRWNRTAHLEMLGYLSPAEFGSRTQELAFVDDVRLTAPPNSPVAGLELALLLDRYRTALEGGGTTALSARQRWEQPDATAALDRALHWTVPGTLRHAGAPADLNLLAYALVRAGRPQEAAAAFEAVGPVVTAHPWELDGDPLAQFTYWRAQVLGPA
ncbi:hypothetical protein ACFV6F_21375 [Kitasatospora phosalacinea]|uniref:hypothetical protein n=1 Tax=Kitasatospora phosalacinea TaxID=2065 RepID=UPI0036586A26